jgi:glycosyltransferase involved in cell wall biosynthesis
MRPLSSTPGQYRGYCELRQAFNLSVKLNKIVGAIYKSRTFVGICMASTVPDHPATAPCDRLVSVILIFLNGEAFIQEAIESVIAQSYSDWELILVDDGSTDKSSEIANEFARRDPQRIRYLDHLGHINRGMSATRNLGIQVARGEFVSFIDADDVWEPMKLADQVEIMLRHAELGLVCGTVVYWGSWSGGQDFLAKTGHLLDQPIPQPQALLALYPLGKAQAPCPSDVMIRAQVLRRVGGFEEHFTAEKQAYEDQGFFSKLYLEAPVFFSSKVWLKYRQHADSCLTSVRRAGQYASVRLYFLLWLKQYLAARGIVEPHIIAAVERSMWRFRHPALHFMLTLPFRILERVLRRIGMGHILYGRQLINRTDQAVGL